MSARRIGLGALFCAWMYGAPALLMIGLIMRSSTPYTPTPAAAEAFGRHTSAVLIAALTVNFALPIAGVILAHLAREWFWRDHFSVALVGMFGWLLVFAVAAGRATGPLIGWTPELHY